MAELRGKRLAKILSILNIPMKKPRFSQRIGRTPLRTELQIDTMDDALRTDLWNFLYTFIFAAAQKRSNDLRSSHQIYNSFFIELWTGFFKNRIDEIEIYISLYTNGVKTWFFREDWSRIYDLLEFVIEVDLPIDRESLRNILNGILERNLSGYRIAGDSVVRITDSNELEEIQDAIDNSGKTGLEGVNEHLKSALDKLADRKSPDYRNSIKESISAVESICKILSGNPNATLGDALKKLKDAGGIDIHGALNVGFSNLYGYTCGPDGIRHAMLDKSDIAFEDAKYMLVSCSAFTNYLIAKAINARIDFKKTTI